MARVTDTVTPQPLAAVVRTAPGALDDVLTSAVRRGPTAAGAGRGGRPGQRRHAAAIGRGRRLCRGRCAAGGSTPSVPRRSGLGRRRLPRPGGRAARPAPRARRAGRCRHPPGRSRPPRRCASRPGRPGRSGRVRARQRGPRLARRVGDRRSTRSSPSPWRAAARASTWPWRAPWRCSRPPVSVARCAEPGSATFDPVRRRAPPLDHQVVPAGPQHRDLGQLDPEQLERAWARRSRWPP